MKLKWDEIGERLYETGVFDVALFVRSATGTYPKGVPWNGVTAINEQPSGAEPTKLYADNRIYASPMSNEEYGAGVEAYTYPDEWAQCDVSEEIAEGVQIGQQKRKIFGLAYKTLIGNDVEDTSYGYKLHLMYGGQAAPSEKSYSTVNDAPEAITFSWDVTTTPVEVTGYKPTSILTIDSTKTDPAKLKLIEEQIYGRDANETESIEAIVPHLLLPDEIAAMLSVG